MSFDFIQPTANELAKVEINKKRLADTNCTHKFSDVTILRFIRGHKGDEEKAFHFMEKHVEWRKSENVDNIPMDSISNMVAAKKGLMHGFDKKGRPIVNVIARRHDGYNRDMDEVKRFIIYLLESTMKRTNPAQEQLTIVFDLHQFGMQCMDYDSVKLLVGILQVRQ